MRYRSLTASLILPALLGVVASCNQPTTTDDLGPLVYKQQYSANVSALYGQSPIGRKKLTDGYAPDFKWRSSDGTLDSLSAHQGQVVLLNFWATWCPPCKNEMPDLEAIKQQFGDSLFVVGVATDYPGDPFTTVRQFVSDNHYSYQFVVDSAFTLFTKYLLDPTSGIPETFLLDRAGNARISYLGEQTRSTFVNDIRKVWQY